MVRQAAWSALVEGRHCPTCGSIVSIDVDSEITQRATELLTGAKYKNVLLVTADDLWADRVLPNGVGTRRTSSASARVGAAQHGQTDTCRGPRLTAGGL
jgi:predicted O-methyltransferase YrrM